MTTGFAELELFEIAWGWVVVERDPFVVSTSELDALRYVAGPYPNQAEADWARRRLTIRPATQEAPTDD